MSNAVVKIDQNKYVLIYKCFKQLQSNKILICKLTKDEITMKLKLKEEIVRIQVQGKNQFTLSVLISQEVVPKEFCVKEKWIPFIQLQIKSYDCEYEIYWPSRKKYFKRECD